MRTIEWRGDHVVLIDQTRLPQESVWLEVRDVDTMIDAIRRLAVRGAPAIGVAGGFGVALAALRADAEGRGDELVRGEAARIAAARPTAVNLSWAVGACWPASTTGVDAVVAEAVAVCEEDVADQPRPRRPWRRPAGGVGAGADARPHALQRRRSGVRGVGHGARDRAGAARTGPAGIGDGRRDPTAVTGRPADGLRAGEQGIEHRIVVDGAGPSVIARGLADAVVVGADRIAANGDVANKIGTYPLALAAARAGIPFVVAAPESTLDPATPSGADIEIEERDPDEVLGVGDRRVAPDASGALNLAFDVTPADLVTAIVTERRVIRPAARASASERRSRAVQGDRTWRSVGCPLECPVPRPTPSPSSPPASQPPALPRPADRRRRARPAGAVRARSLVSGVTGGDGERRCPGPRRRRRRGDDRRRAGRRRDRRRGGGRRARGIAGRHAATASTAASSTSTSTSTTTSTTVAPTAGPPTAADPAQVLVVGDSDAGTFGPYLKELLDDTGVAATTVDYKVSSGLSRPDFFDWPAHLRQTLPTVDPDIVVVTFGGNDAQGLAWPSGDVPRSVDPVAQREEWFAGVQAPRRRGDGPARSTTAAR